MSVATGGEAIDRPAGVRDLTREADYELVRAFFDRAARDYVELATGALPDDQTTAEFFSDCPPGCDPSASIKAGWFDGQLLAIADMGFGYPLPGDAYVGLLLVDKSVRSRGIGRSMLAFLEREARQRGAIRMLIAVLDENVRARAFWQRQGFRLEKSFPPHKMGNKTHIRHRMERPL